MEKARTLMDEAQEEHVAHLADMAKLPGVPGAFARLVQQVDPNNVPIFIKSEVERGSNYDDITAAIADAIAYQIVLTACCGTDPRQLKRKLEVTIWAAVDALLAGDVQTDGVALNLENGHADRVTLPGLFNREPRS